MKIKHNDLVPEKKNPFQLCKLGRVKYANILTNIVENYAEGFVLALNGEWGTGKTTFVKMWQASLENEGFKTIYFNAWENDFENEPMTALLGEFRKLVVNNDEKYKSLLKAGAIVTRNVLPAIFKGIMSRYIDADKALDVLQKSIEAATEILDKQVDEYVNKKQGLLDFKIELESFVNSSVGKKPIIFMIDELDRCRPNYAVEVLEKVKHFFSVKGIVFVLSIDKVQLGHSIQGYYGSTNIDSSEYLRRFIDLEYNLPKPDKSEFCIHLYDYFEFNDFFNSEERSKAYDFKEDGKSFIQFAQRLFSDYNYTLRQQERILAYARIVLKSFPARHYLFPDVFLLMLHFKEKDFDLYKSIKECKLSIQELVREFEKRFLKAIEDELVGYDREFILIESRLLTFYNNSFIRKSKSYVTGFKLVDKKEDKFFLTFNLGIDNENYEKTLIDFLNNRGYSNAYSFELNVLINKIDLLDELQ
jgi:hypothetical protein